MTPGQERALRELARLHAADPHGFEVLGAPKEDSDRVVATVSLRIGPLEKREGGLALREREEFELLVPPDFPFEYPGLRVRHTRFAGFPHVIWSRSLCLYQSKLEWNPSDGLFGFFERLALWLGRAARNEMDPVEGPLEPPHYVTDFTEAPVVVRSDAPAPTGSRWIGWALLKKLANRTELLGWRELNDDIPDNQRVALAIMLSEPLPMEFPQRGETLFQELVKCGIERAFLLHLLQLAAAVTPDNEPAYIVVGLPMRRARDGSLRLHIAVWTTSAKYASSLRLAVAESGDSKLLEALRQDLADAVYAVFEATTIKWCHVLDDRSEIVVRRDSRTPIAWFKGKRILLLGCGALGSWSAEIIARAAPAALHVVDNGIVKPGVLARQNFVLDDIGEAKAIALSKRLQSVTHRTDVQGFVSDAHRFLAEDPERLAGYDLVIDCTASSIFQMKLERDWLAIGGNVERLISFVIDAQARHLLGIALGPRSHDGPWSAYLRLKLNLCIDNHRSAIATAFYSSRASEALFQPEPGCSDPTFSGSTADVARLAASALNALIVKLPDGGETHALAGEFPSASGGRGHLEITTLPTVAVAKAGRYRVLVSNTVFNQARACVRQNGRLRSGLHETGGLLWGYWDDAAELIVLLDASGPPPDSYHDPGHFTCGVLGTAAEHEYRMTHSHGACGFVGLWHTHPNLPPQQSEEDVAGMAGLIAGIGQNRRRAVMLIFGRTAGEATAGFYVYESQLTGRQLDVVDIGAVQMRLASPVV